MKKIVFAITNLEIGGAERVLVRLVSKLSKKFEITILTVYGEGELTRELPKEVRVQSIYPKKMEYYSFIKRAWISLQFKLPWFQRRLYRRWVKDQYNVEIAFLEGPVTALLSVPSKARKIAWIHTDLISHYSKKKYPQLRRSYANYEKLIFVSEDSRQKFDVIDFDHSLRSCSRVIHNYNDDIAVQRLGEEKLDFAFSKFLNFVVVARLVEAKGLDRLLRVHRRLIDEGKLHHIYVIGDGPLKDALSSLQQTFGVEDTFHFLGSQSNPYPYMKRADYLLLPSYYEGYPVTLMEGMALNQYWVVTAIASTEVLEDYPNKLIVDNTEEAIYEGMKVLVNEKVPRKRKPYHGTSNEKILEDIVDLIEGEKK